MNKVILVGNLTRDPEPGTTESGISYCRFTVAIKRRTSREDKADFISCIAWRGTADVCVKYLTKGSKVGVAGSIQTGSYDNKSGQKVYTTDVVADEVEFLNSKPMPSKGGMGYPEPPPEPAKITEMQPIEDDGLPF